MIKGQTGNDQEVSKRINAPQWKTAQNTRKANSGTGPEHNTRQPHRVKRRTRKARETAGAMNRKDRRETKKTHTKIKCGNEVTKTKQSR